MEPDLPTTHPRATLVDLLDRVLDKGVFLQADLIISVAGIPLIGARLSVALAGMETMLKYGIMSDWDEAIRALPPELRQPSPPGESPPEQRTNENLQEAVAACTANDDLQSQDNLAVSRYWRNGTDARY